MGARLAGKVIINAQTHAPAAVDDAQRQKRPARPREHSPLGQEASPRQPAGGGAAVGRAGGGRAPAERTLRGHRGERGAEGASDGAGGAAGVGAEHHPGQRRPLRGGDQPAAQRSQGEGAGAAGSAGQEVQVVVIGWTILVFGEGQFEVKQEEPAQPQHPLFRHTSERGQWWLRSRALLTCGLLMGFITSSLGARTPLILIAFRSTLPTLLLLTNTPPSGLGRCVEPVRLGLLLALAVMAFLCSVLLSLRVGLVLVAVLLRGSSLTALTLMADCLGRLTVLRVRRQFCWLCSCWMVLRMLCRSRSSLCISRMILLRARGCLGWNWGWDLLLKVSTQWAGSKWLSRLSLMFWRGLSSLGGERGAGARGRSRMLRLKSRGMKCLMMCGATDCINIINGLAAPHPSISYPAHNSPTAIYPQLPIIIIHPPIHAGALPRPQQRALPRGQQSQQRGDRRARPRPEGGVRRA